MAAPSEPPATKAATKPGAMAANRRAQPRADQAHSPDYMAIQKKLISWVGALCLLIPVLALLSGQISGCLPRSISHSYYLEFGGITFVLPLAAAAALLIVFWTDTPYFSYFSLALGGLMLVVAAVPTTGPPCLEAPDTARAFFTDGPQFHMDPEALSARIHRWAAQILIAAMAWLCAYGFTRVTRLDIKGGDTISDAEFQSLTAAEIRARVKPVKRLRNTIYALCATVMIGVIALYLWRLKADTLQGHDVLLIETAALWAFGLAWLVKGRVWNLGLKSSGT